MRLTRKFSAAALCILLNLTVLTPLSAFGQVDGKVALQRGYRTGYSDGYMAGYRDAIDKESRDFTRHSDYDKASRAYNKEYGALEDYRDGYRQGFEPGYAAGYEKRSFESTVPENIARRGLSAITPPAAAPVAANEPPPNAPPVTEQITPPSTTPQPPTPPADYSDNTSRVTPGTFIKTTFTPVSDAVIIIPKDTELILELQEAMTTANAKEGDRFTAKVISPTEIAGAMVEGHVAKVTKPGRIKRRSEMQLSFNRIILTQDRWSNFDALLTEILPVKGDNIKRVDNEGLAQGDRNYKGDLTKIGAATGTGVTIGAIAGGPVGAGIGAGIGAAFGVGAVVIERGKHIKLNPNQQLRVRTSFETQIR